MLYLKALLCVLSFALLLQASTTVLKLYWLGVIIYWAVNTILELINNY